MDDDDFDIEIKRRQMAFDKFLAEQKWAPIGWDDDLERYTTHDGYYPAKWIVVFQHVSMEDGSLYSVLASPNLPQHEQIGLLTLAEANI